MMSCVRCWENMSSNVKRKPRIGVFKFASCDGCQLTLLEAEDELLGVARAVDIAYFPEVSRAMLKGPYDIGLVEGSITTHHDAQRIQAVRRQCKKLITIGACATAGGIQALRNWKDVDEFIRVVYATPQYISTLKLSTPISEHVPVDFELRGCPINKHQLHRADHSPAGRPQTGHSGIQRLPGVQTQRQRLYYSGPRRRMPGTCHPRWLRRAVPEF